MSVGQIRRRGAASPSRSETATTRSVASAATTSSGQAPPSAVRSDAAAVDALVPARGDDEHRAGGDADDAADRDGPRRLGGGEGREHPSARAAPAQEVERAAVVATQAERGEHGEGGEQRGDLAADDEQAPRGRVGAVPGRHERVVGRGQHHRRRLPDEVGGGGDPPQELRAARRRAGRGRRPARRSRTSAGS